MAALRAILLLTLILQAVIGRDLSSRGALLITDDGTENMGAVRTYMSQQKPLGHAVAQKDIVFSNSMVEAVNKKVKHQWLYRKTLASYSAVKRALSSIVEEYMQIPLHALSGLMPTEALRGDVADVKQRQAAMAIARAARKANNLASCSP